MQFPMATVKKNALYKNGQIIGINVPIEKQLVRKCNFFHITIGMRFFIEAIA
jgi:hypothetical protein